MLFSISQDIHSEAKAIFTYISTFTVYFCRVIDVGSEWRTFSNESNSTDRSRVGASEVIISLKKRHILNSL